MKPFRETITKYLAEAEQMPLSDLLSLGAFFWDLTRTGIEHKGFRLQASKVGKAICSRLKKGEEAPLGDAFIDASCFCATRGFWHPSYDFNQPPWAERLSKAEPKVAAAFIGWVVQSSYAEYSLFKFKPLIDSVQQAAKTEKDPFYRYRFEQVALTANEIIAESDRRRNSSGMMDRFYDQMGDDDNDDEPNRECQCPKCRAERAKQAARSGGPKPKDSSAQTQRQQLLDLDYDAFDDEDDFEEDIEDELEEDEFELEFGSSNQELDAFLSGIAAQMGVDRMEEFAAALALAASEVEHARNPSIVLRSIGDVFRRFGLPYERAAEFVQIMAKQANFPAQAQQPPMTAEERKAADKKRRRELEKKTKRR